MYQHIYETQLSGTL